jgi:hypothetical protein
MKSRISLTGVLAAILLLFAWPALAQPLADYGDAPDPTFPSLFASGGPWHTNLTDCWVGWGATAEPNALVPNQDFDDGTPLIFANYALGGWTAWVYFPITISAAASTHPRFLNVLLDVNSSGTWCDIPGEWIVRNFQLPKWFLVHYPGQTVWYCIGGYSGVTDYSGVHWLRITLSDMPVVADVPGNGWSGRWPGGFGFGETEDWVLGWHYNPPLPPDPPGPPPNSGTLPLPDPIPACNKTGTIYQSPAPPHVGHSGNFSIVVENTSSNHPMHIVEGPYATDVNGSPINLNLPSLESTYITPGGGKAASGGTWTFPNSAPNATYCDWGAVVDPQGTYVVIENVGNYADATSNQPTGGAFLELATPLMTQTGLVVLFVALVLTSVYFLVRRHRLATRG